MWQGWLDTTELCSQSAGCVEYVNLPEVSFYVPRAVRVNESHIFVWPNQHGNAWLFNQLDETFQELPPFLEERVRAAVGFINDHEIVVAGGQYSNTSEIFDLNTSQWRPGPDLPVKMELFGASCVQFQQTFLVVGGHDSGENLGSIIKFDPVNYVWITMPQKLTKAREYFAAFLVPNDYVSC